MTSKLYTYLENFYSKEFEKLNKKEKDEKLARKEIHHYLDLDFIKDCLLLNVECRDLKEQVKLLKIAIYKFKSYYLVGMFFTFGGFDPNYFIQNNGDDWIPVVTTSDILEIFKFQGKKIDWSYKSILGSGILTYAIAASEQVVFSETDYDFKMDGAKFKELVYLVGEEQVHARNKYNKFCLTYAIQYRRWDIATIILEDYNVQLDDGETLESFLTRTTMPYFCKIPPNIIEMLLDSGLIMKSRHLKQLIDDMKYFKTCDEKTIEKFESYSFLTVPSTQEKRGLQFLLTFLI